MSETPEPPVDPRPEQAPPVIPTPPGGGPVRSPFSLWGWVLLIAMIAVLIWFLM